MSRHIPMLAAIALAITYALATSCGYAAEQYWVKTGAANVVERVLRVPNIYAVCRLPFAVEGCTVPGNYGGVILYIAADAPDQACVESHERKHAAGYSHHDRPANQIVC